MNDNTQTYLFGIAKCDITPPVGIKLAGWKGLTESSTGVCQRLRSVAMAMDDGQTPVLFVTADWVGFTERTAALRQLIHERTGLPPEQIVLSASHTHRGPVTREKDAPFKGPVDYEYVNAALEKMAECAEQAWQARTPARIEAGSGECGFAASRRKPDGKGGVYWGPWRPDREAPHDHEVPVLKISSPEGAVRAVVFSYACHPTERKCLEIGAGYPGYALDRIEERFPGATACFLIGCAGDQKPYSLNPDTQSFGNMTLEESRAIGEQLGDEVVSVAQRENLNPVSGPIRAGQMFLDLHMDGPDPDLVRRGLQSDIAVIREWAEFYKDRPDSEVVRTRPRAFEIQTISFGETLVIITMAAEMNVEHGLRLKRELGPRFRQVWPLGYTNEMVGYIPVARQIPEGGYEVIYAQMHNLRPGPYAHGTEGEIHDAVAGLLESGLESSAHH